MVKLPIFDEKSQKESAESSIHSFDNVLLNLIHLLDKQLAGVREKAGAEPFKKMREDQIDE